MASKDEALLILDLWRDERTPLDFMEVVPAFSKGEMISIERAIWPVRIAEVSRCRILLLSVHTPKEKSFELPVACTFTYSAAPNDSPFLIFASPEEGSERYGSVLQIESADGRMIILAEHPSE
jgi:hypothetical protein